MLRQTKSWVALVLILQVFGTILNAVDAKPFRILLDTDVATDDFFALFYLLKLNPSEFLLEAITINTNIWSDAGHAVNHIYDLLYVMNRDDIAVGVGGEGGILENGTILPNVGGYLPIIEQGMTTVGYCRYRQAIPVGRGGRLDTDTNFVLRKAFLPQGSRKYSPVQQPTAQQLMIEAISAGPITMFLIGAHTNLAVFLMNNPHLKKNIGHIYMMGGGVRPENSSGCCFENASSSCLPSMCGYPGNLFTDYNSNPYAEFNIFGDPFAAYQVFYSGIPITIVPLDATDTIPITEEFFKAFEESQGTYEAEYCFQSLKTKIAPQSAVKSGMYNSFMAGVAVSIMRNSDMNNGENEFAEMEYMNVTVVNSNKPYGVHSGHVQTGLRDPFCFVKNGKGKCKDGYTMEVTGPDAVQVLVATKAKPNPDVDSKLDRQFFISFLDVLNRPEHTGRFNLMTEFPYYREVLYKPDLGNKKLGKHVFDMDMSAGDFLPLFYLLKVPVEVLNLKVNVFTSKLHQKMHARASVNRDGPGLKSRFVVFLGIRYFQSLVQPQT